MTYDLESESYAHRINNITNYLNYFWNVYIFDNATHYKKNGV